MHFLWPVSLLLAGIPSILLWAHPQLHPDMYVLKISSFFLRSKYVQLIISHIPSQSPLVHQLLLSLPANDCFSPSSVYLLCGSANSSLALQKAPWKDHYLHWIGIKHFTELLILDVHLEDLTNIRHAQILVDRVSFYKITSALAVDITSVWVQPAHLIASAS